MTMTLAPKIAEMIRARVEAGPYGSADELLEEALIALDERDGREQLDRLRAKLQVGRDQIARGESVEFTPQWAAGRLERAIERAAAGEQPHPVV